MKSLLYLLAGAFHLTAAAQSFPVKNINDECLVSSIYQADISRNNFHDFLKDKNGLYWFQNATEVYSFDGVNWKSYELRSVNGSKKRFRINALTATDDGNIWMGTENGMYVFDPLSECFISSKEKFPEIKNVPQAITCFEPSPAGTLVFISFFTEGFYVLNMKSKKITHVIIDSSQKTYIPRDGLPVTVDKSGNLWGTTTDYRGVWHYDFKTGKILCSWKNELPQFAHRRFNSFADYAYSVSDNSLWISHRTNRYVERMDMRTGESRFFSFTGNLQVRTDTNAVDRYDLFPVKIDKENRAWVRAGEKYIIRLNKDASKMEYLCHDRDMLPIGEVDIFRPELSAENDRNNILLWIQGIEKLSMIKMRGNVIRHVYFDTLSAPGFNVKDYMNEDARQNIYWEKGRNGNYFLLQQKAGRPKLTCFDKNLHVKKILFNDEWKDYPAFFKREFDPDTLYIAMLRPGTEPLDFRNVVLKEFRIDLATLSAEEVKLNFRQRAVKYGAVDMHNVYWLFSNGFLYSYNPGNNVLDSIYICKPAEKGANAVSMIKGYDYPTALHRNSSTFWISFFPVRQLYKINLETKKIDKVFKTCMDQKDCDLPGAVYDLYVLDRERIYLKQSFSGALLNVKNDSLTDLSQIFQKKLPIDIPGGASICRDWLCFAFPSDIYLLNTVTGKEKHLMLNEDFKWRLSILKSKPLLNDYDEFIFPSNRGFLVFNIDSTPLRKEPGSVHFSFIKIDGRNLTPDSLLKNKGLFLKYNQYNTIQLAFSDYSVFAAEKSGYEYCLYKGKDTVWSKINGKPELTLSDLSPGEYQLLIRASNVFGDYSKHIRVFPIEIIPLWWQTWWLKMLVAAIIGIIVFGLYRYRLEQLKRLQIIRNNIASDLHDDIGSTLNSISIYSEVAKQQAGKDIPALELIGMNSRKIVDSMSDIVWTINPENDSFEKIISRMRSFAYQLLKAKQIEFSFEVDENLNSISLPMQVRKNFYLVFKEAVTNVIKYSGASRVLISLCEENKVVVLKIRDNGKGIPDNPEVHGNGLANMKRRAQEIHGSLFIHSANGEGTGIELRLKT
jgi:two-component sensor histidine kinase